MKSLILVVAGLLCGSAFAADVVKVIPAPAAHSEGAIIMSSPTVTAASTEKTNVTEFGLQYSSINDGSPHAAVALVHEWNNGFGLGARGLMPMTYTKQAQVYMGQVLARFMILNEKDQMYIEPTFGIAYFNGTDSTKFAMLGASYGYMHQFTNTLAAGGSLGVDYGNKRVTEDTWKDEGTLYNKISVQGAYHF